MEKTSIAKRKKWLKEIIAEKRGALGKAPKGSLRISDNHGSVMYYHVVQDHGVISETYIPKENVEKISALAQKSYDRQVLKVAIQELQALNFAEKYFPDMAVEDIYEKVSQMRQRHVTPIIQTDEEYSAQWEATEYAPGYFKEGMPVYKTDKGERVRSKSEQLLANLIFRLGIPYRYEYPIDIYVHGEKRRWRPDFTILDVKNRKEYHLEHFGMLDDKEYAESAFRKMRIYEENGLYEGETMIYSFETSQIPPDFEYIEMKLRRLLAMN